jgi:hypothetical protein
MTFQNIDLSSWDILYTAVFACLWHWIYKMLKLGGGQAYDCWNDLAAYIVS